MDLALDVRCPTCSAPPKAACRGVATHPARELFASRETSESVALKATNPKDHEATARIPLSLLSPIACAHWALAQFAGKQKYGSWNWRAAGVRSSVYLDAARRHLDAYGSGEELDPVDGTHHLGNVMACMGILIDAEAAGKLVDDRPPRVDLRPAYAYLEKLAATLIAKYKDRKPRHWTIADTEEIQKESKDP